MRFEGKRLRSLGLILLAALLSGTLLVLALPLGEHGGLAWFMLVPLLLTTRGQGFLVGFVGGLIAVLFAAWVSTTGVLYAHHDLSGPPTWVYGGFGKFGISFAAAFAVWGDPGTRRWPSWCFAALGVLLEAVQLFQLPAHLALTQYRHASMVQLASVGGVWLVSFLIWWANFALAVWVSSRTSGVRSWLPSLLVGSLVVGIALAVVQNAWISRVGPMHRFAAIQLEEPEAKRLSAFQARASQTGAELVVWPEFSGIAMSSSTSTEQLRRLSDRPGSAPFVTTFRDDFEPLPHNVAALFSRGTESERYAKRKLFGGESNMHTAGDHAVAVGHVGLNICFDSCYPAVIHDTAKLGATLIALPTIDPPSTNHFLAAIHAAYTPFRAAESGVAFVRADGGAYSQIVDARGRIVAETVPGDRLLIGEAQIGPRPTLYKSIGDAFLWFSGALFAFGVWRSRVRIPCVTSYIALLRGVNVGGKGMVKMAELRTMLEGLGLSEVGTLLQSGNVVFRTKARKRAELEAMLEKAVEEHFDKKVAFHVRTAAEVEEAMADNPFEEAAKEDASHLLIVFLKNPPDTDEVEKVQKAIKGPELVRAGKEHLYMHYPDDIGHSKVDRTPGWKKLNEGGTGRNWNTLLKLAAMAGEKS